jgi:hypothetical protein
MGLPAASQGWWAEDITLRLAYACLGLADRTLFAQFRTTPGFARFFVVFAFSQLLLDSTAFKQFLEASQSQANRLSVMNTHP